MSTALRIIYSFLNQIIILKVEKGLRGNEGA
jgi:hypothetical protein